MKVRLNKIEVPNTPLRFFLNGRPTLGVYKRQSFSNTSAVATFQGYQYLPSHTEVELITPDDPDISKVTLLRVSQGSSFSLGADPEVFVRDKDGTVIPAWKFLPAKEGAPWGIFWDGFQAEFTMRPQPCISYFVDYVQEQLNRVLIAARAIYPGARLTSKCVVDIPQEMMDAATDEHTQLGCAPSTNIYGTAALPVTTGRDIPFRFAGCHIHVGLPESIRPHIPSMVKNIDALAGVCSVSLLEGLEDERRRYFYGLAGEYRTPPHGLEYRVLSSAVLAHPVALHVLLSLIRAAVELSPDAFPWEYDEERIQRIINTLDVADARSYLTEHMDVIPDLFERCYGGQAYGEGIDMKGRALHLIQHGLKNSIALGQMERAWLIPNGHWLSHSGNVGRSIHALQLKEETVKV